MGKGKGKEGGERARVRRVKGEGGGKGKGKEGGEGGEMIRVRV